jgi:MFS family permease
MRTLSRRASFWTSAAVAAIALWTSAAPTVSYPLYAEEWDLTPAVTTAIFAVYPIVLVVVLAVFGNLSDYIGRRATILLGLTGSLIGVLLFALAPSVEWLFVGRAFMGIGVALSLSPATAAIVEFSAPGQSARASSITTASTAVGLILATLVGGALIEYAPLPTHLNYAVLVVVVAAVLALAWFLPRHTSAESRGRWRPRGLAVPAGIRRHFAVGAIAVTSAYAVGAVVLSLGADIAHTLIGSDNSLVNGAVLALNAVAIAVAAIAGRGLRPLTIVVAGGASAIVGMSVMVLSSVEHSLLLFLIASVVTGVGYSFLFAGGLGVVSANAPAHHRAGTLSAVYLVAYFVQGVVALGLGSVATGSGFQLALEIGAGAIALFSIAAIVLSLAIGSRPAAAAGATA